MTTNKTDKTPRSKQQFIAFFAPPAMVERIDRLAEANERNRSQELRHMLKTALQMAEPKPNTHPSTEN